MSIKHEIRRILWKIGYDIYKFTPDDHPIARKKQIFKTFKIDIVLDIGASTGLFAKQLRNDIDYKNKILSFEPLRAAFDVLKKNAKGDSNWEVFNYALGDNDEKKEINIADNLFSSSLLDMLPSHLEAAPSSMYIGKELVDIKTLDSLFSDLCDPAKKVYMKLDTQGYESKVLTGANRSLKMIDFVQMEMSLLPLFEGEVLFNDMCLFMAEKGFNLIGIETVFTDQFTGRLLQVDGIFQAAVSQ